MSTVGLGTRMTLLPRTSANLSHRHYRTGLSTRILSPKIGLVCWMTNSRHWRCQPFAVVCLHPQLVVTKYVCLISLWAAQIWRYSTQLNQHINCEKNKVKKHYMLMLISCNDKGVRLVNFATSKTSESKVRCSHIATSINILGRLQMGKPTIRLTIFW
jgi:hypothetical protein